MRTLKLSLLFLILNNQCMLTAMEVPSDDIATVLAPETTTETIVPDSSLEDIAAFATIIIVASAIAYAGEKEDEEEKKDDTSGCTIL